MSSAFFMLPTTVSLIDQTKSFRQNDSSCRSAQRVTQDSQTRLAFQLASECLRKWQCMCFVARRRVDRSGAIREPLLILIGFDWRAFLRTAGGSDAVHLERSWPNGD